MFIDDERFPPDDGKKWVICREKLHVIHTIFEHDYTVPNFISFDHDLGENKEDGYDIAKWIVDFHIEGVITIPDDFDFYVHSQNPIGKKNIEYYLNNYMNFYRKGMK